MAFAIRNLSVLAYANGFTLWHYKSGKDRLNQVEKLDFFADAADMLAGGDMLMVSAPDGGRIVTVAPGEGGRGGDRTAGVVRDQSVLRAAVGFELRLRAEPSLSHSLISQRPGRGDIEPPAWTGLRNPSSANCSGREPALSRRPAGRAAQHQPVQRGSAAGLQIGLVPHATHRQLLAAARQAEADQYELSVHE